MILLRRGLAWAGSGALVGALVLLVMYQARPAVFFELDRTLPRSMSGIYGIESAPNETFAWTSARATIRLPGLDRHGEWTCVVRFRGGRPPDVPLPQVSLSVDGVVVGTMVASNAYQDLAITVPPKASSGATLVLASDPTFAPGRGDPRTLGVQLDRLTCNPGRSWVMPPPSALRHAGGAVAVLAVVAMITGASLLEGAVIVSVVAIALAWLLLSGAALFGPFSWSVWSWSLTTAVVLGLFAKGIEIFRRRPLGIDARRVLWLLGVSALLRLLALAHPGKAIVDALFQAHRLEWVLEGRYFFTQPMPSGVTFPYAIGLYVFAAPWASLTNDFVTLLRALIVVMEAVAGGLIYAAVVHNGISSRQALVAVLLYLSVPLPFVVIGNGNLTNAFAQSVALVALTLVALAPPTIGRLPTLAGMTVVATLALSSHVSTAALLGVTLVCVIALFAAFGGSALRPAARGLALSLLLASSASYLLYYRHFNDVFLTAWNRVGAAPAAAAPATPGTGEHMGLARSDTAPTISVTARAAVTGREAVRSFGWPLLALAAIGLLTLRRADLRTALGCVLLACAVVWLGMTAATTATRVGAEFERYAIEFLGRVNLAAYPAVAILGARGTAGLPAVPAIRFLTVGLVALATFGGCQAWVNWFS
jgi:hypothetical protein